MIKAYVKKPVQILALKVEHNEKSIKAALTFLGENYSAEFEEEIINSLMELKGISIATLEGTLLCSWGDYLVRGTQGEFYPVKPNIFEEIYDEAGEVHH